LSNAKQRGDLGLDGKMSDNTPIQVKRSDNIGRNVIDNFKSAIERYDEKLFSRNVAEGKPAGYIIAFSFGRGAVEEVARLKLKSNIIIELVTVDKIVPIAKKPTISVEIREPNPKDLHVYSTGDVASDSTPKGSHGRDAANDAINMRPVGSVREIQFTAVGTSEAGIEFYSWDFDYNEEKGFRADVMIDREGVQSRKFKAGQHAVAVKVVDNDGLESIEVIRLKVNGTVERQ
jgi:hypothetical protein